MRQRVEHQKREIEFRRKLYRQQVEHQKVLDDEFDAARIEGILQERMQKTLEQMTLLKHRGVAVSPYVEIGAERCQRSLVMENDLHLNGAAADISFDLLRSCAYYQGVFARPKAPFRICCDANNLPFLTNSLPFVFCYETLHHFPEPAPILKEVHRVLQPGGHFLFDEEPYKQILHVNLYNGPKVYSGEFQARGRVRRLLDRFFCRTSCNEVEHGIIENNKISVSRWKRALMVFDRRDVTLEPTKKIHTELFDPRSPITYVLACLLGGNIGGICRKRGDQITTTRPIRDVLSCPSCRRLGREEPLRGRHESPLRCPHCSSTYPVVEGVAFLLAHDTLKALYPEVFNALH